MSNEEQILQRLNLGELKPKQKKLYLESLSETVVSQLMLECVQAFHELEIGRLEYLIEQNDTVAINQELASKFADVDALMIKIQNQIVAEITDTQTRILAVANASAA